VNPLTRLRAWQNAPDGVLFRVRLSEPTPMRLAVLDEYDGVRFSANPRYTPAGAALPPPPAGDPGAGAPTRAVTADVVIADLDGPWVPAPDRPSRVSGPAVAVDPATGVLVAPGGLRPGQRYQVAATIAVDGGFRSTSSLPASPEQVGVAATAIPGLPPELLALATDVSRDANDPGRDPLATLEEWFRTKFREKPDDPPGHSMARLTPLLLGEREQVGSTEQLAAGFALLARSLGYPSRVAVGFRPPAGRGEIAVRGADARAWPEVALMGRGWVAFDPVPPRDAPRNPANRSAEASGLAPPATTTSSTLPQDKTDPAPHPQAKRRVRSWRPAMAGGGLALAGLFVTAGAIVGFKRRRRSARRRAPDPVDRVRGAWAEAVDRLVERGLGRPPSRTPREVADAVAVVSLGASGPLADLGDLADRAAFAGADAVARADADRAWADLELLEMVLDAEDSRPAAIRRALDPRPLITRC